MIKGIQSILMEKNLQKKNSRKANPQNIFLTSLFAGLFFLSFPLFSSEKEPVSVGVVNVTFLMKNAPQADLASNNLKEKFLPQEKKLAEELEKINVIEGKLEKLISSRNINDDIKRKKEREIRSRKRARSRSLQDFREELRFARDAALDDVQKEVFSAIDDVRKIQKIDIIIQDFISANKRVDITPLVLEYLKSKLSDAPQKTNKNTEQDLLDLENNDKSEVDD